MKKVRIMKKVLLLIPALLGSALVGAQEVGRVISSTPVIQQIGVPRQVCTTETVAVQQQKSGAGALIGAIAGGAMGNAIGGGSGKAAATMIGLMGGAIVGDQIEGAPQSQLQNVQRCGVQNYYENRTVAYNVVYEFSGKQYSVQMPNDPGQYGRLQVNPVGTLPPPAQTYQQYQQPNVVYSQPATVYVQPAPTVVYAQPYYQQPYYPPIGISLGFGYRGGYGGGYRGGYGHWR